MCFACNEVHGIHKQVNQDWCNPAERMEREPRPVRSYADFVDLYRGSRGERSSFQSCENRGKNGCG